MATTKKDGFSDRQGSAVCCSSHEKRDITLVTADSVSLLPRRVDSAIVSEVPCVAIAMKGQEWSQLIYKFTIKKSGFSDHHWSTTCCSSHEKTGITLPTTNSISLLARRVDSAIVSEVPCVVLQMKRQEGKLTMWCIYYRTYIRPPVCLSPCWLKVYWC